MRTYWIIIYIVKLKLVWWYWLNRRVKTPFILILLVLSVACLWEYGGEPTTTSESTIITITTTTTPSTSTTTQQNEKINTIFVNFTGYIQSCRGENVYVFENGEWRKVVQYLPMKGSFIDGEYVWGYGCDNIECYEIDDGISVPLFEYVEVGKRESLEIPGLLLPDIEKKKLNGKIKIELEYYTDGECLFGGQNNRRSITEIVDADTLQQYQGKKTTTSTTTTSSTSSQTTITTISPEIGPQIIIRTGTSFGMCIGYCSKEISITSNEIIFTKSGWNTEGPLPVVTEKTFFSEEEWKELIENIEMDRFSSLPDRIGCPDCADGGSEWIEISEGSITKKVTFEYGSSPQEINSKLLSGLREVRENIYSKFDDSSNSTPPKTLETTTTIVKPDDNESCEFMGGRWVKTIYGEEICFLTTSDGGKECFDSNECEGACLAELSKEEEDKLSRMESVKTNGTCAESTPLIGIVTIVKDGKVDPYSTIRIE
jgi:hypothetical protein